jgi:hypothetical protein
VDRFLHLVEMSCVDVSRRGQALIAKRFMSPLITARMARELADSESGVSG